MLHTNNLIIKHKVELLDLAEEQSKFLQSLQDYKYISRYVLSLSRTGSDKRVGSLD